MVQVSVIIPAYNAEKTLTRAVNSVLKQTMRDFEVLIVDNGSSDGTSDLISKLVSNDNRVRSLESEKGRSRARNKGLKESRGLYVQFLDADDELLPEKLADGLKFLQKHADIDAYITSVIYKNDHHQTEKLQVTHLKSTRDLLKANYLPISAPLIRNSGLAAFREELEYNEDWLFWAETLVGRKIELHKSVGSIIHITSNNTMSQLDKMQIYECYVRGILKEEFSSYGVKYWKRDIKLSVNFLLSEKDETSESLKISKTMFWPLTWARFALSLPFLRSLLVRKWRSIRNDSMYG